jgi:hypothetical protein
MAAAILVVLFAISAVDADASEPADTPTAVVRLDNIALVPSDYLEFAESRAAEVFSRIGVRVTWIDEDTAFREHLRPPFTVVLIKSDVELLARPAVVDVDALGFADPSVSRAHVVYDRVEALTARSQRSAASLLGDVIAHELGHLMLPSRSHSARGIMRSGVEVQTRALETFTDPQAKQILSRLTVGR